MLSDLNKLNILLVQFSASASFATNCQIILSLIQQNALKNNNPLDLIVLPEMWTDLGHSKPLIVDSIENHFVGDFLRQLASKYQCYVVAGSLRHKNDSASLPYNMSVVLSPDSSFVGSYRKMNLFTLNNSLSIDETALYSPGNQPFLFTIKNWTFGLSICFDIRFPELYRFYAKKGCDGVISCSAFTQQTGQKHWLPLLQARSIENRFFTINCNQCLTGGDHIERFGHSCILSPDGSFSHPVSSPQKSQTIFTTIDLKELHQHRKELQSPPMTHLPFT